MPKGKRAVKPVEEEVVEEVEVVATPAKKEKVSISVEFFIYDAEGVKERKLLESEGGSVKEALLNLDFPQGLNRLFVVRVVRGDREYEVRVPTHKARAMFVDKSEVAFKSVFGF